MQSFAVTNKATTNNSLDAESTFINKNNPNTLVYLISFSESLATFQILTYKVSLKNVNYSRFCVKISH